jgi:hypothetical protein
LRAANLALLEVLASLRPDGISRELMLLERTAPAFEAQPGLPHLNLPAHHVEGLLDEVGQASAGGQSRAAHGGRNGCCS